MSNMKTHKRKSRMAKTYECGRKRKDGDKTAIAWAGVTCKACLAKRMPPTIELAKKIPFNRAARGGGLGLNLELNLYECGGMYAVDFGPWYPSLEALLDINPALRRKAQAMYATKGEK